MYVKRMAEHIHQLTLKNINTMCADRMLFKI